MNPKHSRFSEGEYEEGRDGSREDSRLSSSESRSEFRLVNGLDGSVSQSGVFPTYFVFLDLPKHIEYRSQDLPLLKEGLQMDFNLNIKDPRKTRKIEGTHIITRVVLKYGVKRPGITQYIEWKSLKKG